MKTIKIVSAQKSEFQPCKVAVVRFVDSDIITTSGAFKTEGDNGFLKADYNVDGTEQGE